MPNSTNAFPFYPHQPCVQDQWDVYTGPNYKRIVYNGCEYLVEYWLDNRPSHDKIIQITQRFVLAGDNCNISSVEVTAHLYSEIWKQHASPMGNPYFAIDQQFSCFDLAQKEPNTPMDLIASSTFFSQEILDSIDYEVMPNGNDIRIPVGTAMFPCTGTVCCEVEYYLMYDNGELVSMEWTGAGGDPTEICTDSIRVCTNNCNALKFNWYAPGYEPEGYTGINKDSLPLSFTKIKPNPNKGIFELSVESESRGSLKILIFDIQGNLVYNNEFDKNSNIFSTELNVKNLPNGSYYYQIIIGGVQSPRSSFTIIK